MQGQPPPAAPPEPPEPPAASGVPPRPRVPAHPPRPIRVAAIVIATATARFVKRAGRAVGNVTTSAAMVPEPRARRPDDRHVQRIRCCLTAVMSTAAMLG